LAESGSYLVYYVENRSFLGKQLKRIFNKEIFIDIETILSQAQLEKLKNDFSKDNLTTAEIKMLSDKLLFDIFESWIKHVTNETTDSRITKAIEYINNNLSNSITLNDVANYI